MIFYSILPNVFWIKPTFLRIARFAPLIGLIIGIFQSFIWLALKQAGWSTEASSLCLIGFGAWITGGLHLDGLMDTADGIAAGPEKLLTAMRDSRIGASGIQALLIIVLIQVSTLIKLNSFSPIALIISASISRISPIFAINKFNYLHKEGLGLSHKKNWKGIKQEILPSLVCIVILILLGNIFVSDQLVKIKLLISIFAGLISAISTAYFLGKRLGGHSGDSYGASVVISETTILLFLSFIL